MSSVFIHSLPPREFYDISRRTASPDLAYRRLLSIPSYRSYLGESEVDSGSIEIDNSDGYLSTLFSDPPVGAKVEIFTDAETLLKTGYIVEVSIQRSVMIIRLEG